MAAVNGYITPDTSFSGASLQPTPFKPSFNAHFANIDPALSTPANVLLQNLSPPAGTDLAATQPISFDLVVTPPAILTGAGRIIIWVVYLDLNGQSEVVFDSDNFSAAFSGASSYTDTFSLLVFQKRTFKILRTGGWPSRPKLYVHANSNLGGINP